MATADVNVIAPRQLIVPVVGTGGGQPLKGAGSLFISGNALCFMSGATIVCFPADVSGAVVT